MTFQTCGHSKGGPEITRISRRAKRASGTERADIADQGEDEHWAKARFDSRRLRGLEEPPFHGRTGIRY
jgi:hypothetical protein